MSGSCGSGANSFGAGRAVTTGGAGAAGAGAGAAATGGAGAAATGAPVGGGAAAWVTAGCLAQPVTNRARMTAAETSAWRERVMVSSPSYGQARACNGRSAEAIGPWSQAVKTRNGVDTSVVPERVNAAPADHSIVLLSADHGRSSRRGGRACRPRQPPGRSTTPGFRLSGRFA